jgi:3-oxoacyl-[acyl-carrier-protein] synthase III
MYVLDNRMRPVAVGITGELYIGGAGVSPGYRGRPDLNAERFVRLPFASNGAFAFRTGDIARVRADGTFVCLGRIDDQVKIRGYRVELGEIEAVLRRHAAVREAAVVCRSNRGSAQPLLAYVVAHSVSDTMPDRNGAERALAKSLRQFLKTVLPDYMQPSDFIFVDSIALTPSGKIDRRALPTPSTSRRHVLSEPTSGHSEIENILLAGWKEVLGVQGLGVHDNFFELGGASLQTLQLTDVAARAGLTITPELVFRYQTVAELAAFLEDAGSAHDVLATSATVAGTAGETASAITASVDQRTVSRAADPIHRTASSRQSPTGNTVIESLGVYLPARVVSTSSIVSGCDAPILFPLERMTGIHSRRMADETESSLDLAARAVEECLARSKYRPPDVDLVISCSISRYAGPLSVTFEPSLSVQLRHRFGFERALTFDLNSACTGMFTAIHLADTLIREGAVRCALIVSGERISALTSAAQREIRDFMDARLACLTVGDAGAAVMLESSQRSDVGFHELGLYTLGRYSDLCIAKLSDQPHGGAIMVTDAVRQTAVGIKNAVLHATHTLARRQWPPESFQHLIMHQTSETALRDAMRAINLAYGRNVCHDGNTVLNLAERGNTASTSHFVALADSIDSGRVQPGDRVVFGISGSGQTIGTGLYTIDDLPDRRRRGSVAQASHGGNGRRGIRERPPRSPRVRIASVGVAPPSHERQTALALATQAAEECLRRAGIDGSRIGLLVYVGVYRDEYLCEPALAAILAGKLDLNADVPSVDGPTTLAFDITNGAVGFMNACYLVEEMIGAGRASRALVVAAEIENNALVSPQSLRGLKETGTAVLLERTSQSGVGFGNFAFVADTSRLESERTYTQHDGRHTSLAICRESALDEAYMQCIAETSRAVLDREGLVPADLAVVLPPAISPSFVRALGRRLDLPRARCLNVAADGQDLFTSSIPYAAHEALRDGAIQPGDIALMISAGSGVQAASAIYYF